MAITSSILRIDEKRTQLSTFDSNKLHQEYISKTEKTMFKTNETFAYGR